MHNNLKQFKKHLLVLTALVLLLPPLVTTSLCVINQPQSPVSLQASPDPGWTNMTPAASIPSRINSPLVYDTDSDRIIVFSGVTPNFDYYNDTWVYHFNDNTWTNMNPTTHPLGRSAPAMVYDSTADRVICFSGSASGSGSTIVNHLDTWEYNYNTNTWTNRSPSAMPPARLLSGVAYDAESDKVIIFGGVVDGGAFTDDTWAYDYTSNTWTNMNPTTHPSERSGNMVYDSESDRIILFGGFATQTILTDTWAYDYNTNTWTNMGPSTAPTASGGMAYDLVQDRVISFGGAQDWAEYDLIAQTWIYDYNTNTWTQLSEPTHPNARNRNYMAYDSESERTILYGGIRQGGYIWLNDTWAYEYPLPGPIIPIIPLEWILIGVAVIIIVIVIVLIICLIRRR